MEGFCRACVCAHTSGVEPMWSRTELEILPSSPPFLVLGVQVGLLIAAAVFLQAHADEGLAWTLMNPSVMPKPVDEPRGLKTACRCGMAHGLEIAS